MNARDYLAKLHAYLDAVYGTSETTAIGRNVLDYLDRHTKGTTDLNKEWSEQIKVQAESILDALVRGEPLQYILHEAWFDGNSFYVDPSVLIPRPETEELLDWIRKDLHTLSDPIRILEVGTGSGILAISLKRTFPNASLVAIDISDSAIRTAQLNADRLQTAVTFLQMDFIDKSAWGTIGEFDLIVSNPPYISLREREDMPKHVVNHEPADALFVPGDDPLLFYRLIGEFGINQLAKQGSIFVEIHEDRSEETELLFHQLGYTTALRRDMQGKERMIRAINRI